MHTWRGHVRDRSLCTRDAVTLVTETYAPLMPSTLWKGFVDLAHPIPAQRSPAQQSPAQSQRRRQSQAARQPRPARQPSHAASPAQPQASQPASQVGRQHAAIGSRSGLALVQISRSALVLVQPSFTDPRSALVLVQPRSRSASFSFSQGPRSLSFMQPSCEWHHSR